MSGITQQWKTSGPAWRRKQRWDYVRTVSTESGNSNPRSPRVRDPLRQCRGSPPFQLPSCIPNSKLARAFAASTASCHIPATHSSRSSRRSRQTASSCSYTSTTSGLGRSLTSTSQALLPPAGAWRVRSPYGLLHASALRTHWQMQFSITLAKSFTRRHEHANRCCRVLPQCQRSSSALVYELTTIPLSGR